MLASSRATGTVIGWTIAISLFAAGCGGGQKGTAGQSAQPVSGSFVGKVDHARVGVAVVAAKPATGAQARTVSVYVCSNDGSSFSEWFTGQVAGNRANLTSADGRASASVALGGPAARGTITLPGGGRLAFTAAPARGAAGLYAVTVAPNGTARGTSATGGTLTGRVGAANAAPWDGLVAATATAAGQQVKLAAFAQRARPGAYRWIVLPNGTAYGAIKRLAIVGGGGPIQRPPTVTAAKNDGRFSQYARAHHLGDSQLCQGKAARYDDAIKRMDANTLSDGTRLDAGARAAGDAIKQRTEADALGCKWA